MIFLQKMSKKPDFWGFAKMAKKRAKIGGFGKVPFFAFFRVFFEIFGKFVKNIYFFPKNIYFDQYFIQKYFSPIAFYEKCGFLRSLIKDCPHSFISLDYLFTLFINPFVNKYLFHKYLFLIQDLRSWYLDK